MTAYASFGAIFKQSSTTIGQIKSISYDGLTKRMLETTDLTSTNRAATFVSEVRDWGGVTLELHMDPDDTGQDILWTAYGANTAQSYNISYPDNTPEVHTFDAFVDRIEPAIRLGEVLSVTIHLKITGAITIS